MRLALRMIRTDEDPILKKKSRIVEKFDDKLKILIEDMYETMDNAQGVGLAAPQIGVLKRLIVVDDNEETRLTLINPEITHAEGAEIAYEACLSVPERQGEVERATHITVNYVDVDNNKQQIEARDTLARILQHEIDHLNGILYTDIAKSVYVVTDKEKEGEN
ncbi:peptide deformylase [Peptoniphilus sp. ING2-D1G]|nr:peptide deformylase [Peptoniphilus sp. ING2-D1G]